MHSINDNPQAVKSYQRLLLALSSVVLLSLGWLRTSGLPLLVAFVPLLLISASYPKGSRPFWRMFGWTALTMGLWTVVTVWWIWYAAAVGTVAATIINIFFFGGIFMLYHAVSKRAKPALAYTVLICGWIWAEQYYLNGQVSFPWLILGNGFANDVWAVQWYEFTGAFGGSLWVLLTNVLVFEALRTRSRRKAVAAAATALVPVAVSLVMYFSYKEPKGDKAVVTLVQPNFEPYTEKYSMPLDEQLRIMLALAARAPVDADYIVFPETVIGDLDDQIWEEDIFRSRSVNAFRSFRAELFPETQIVTGAMTSRLYPSEAEASPTAHRSASGLIYDRYNSALALDADSVLKVSHKSRLVVGVEKMPYMELLKPLKGLIQDLGGTTGQLGYDVSCHTFAMRSARHPSGLVSAAPICYESVYGEHFSDFVKAGAQIIFVITNDGWWHDTEGYRQHFSYSRLRAIETRRWVCRAANTGISGFISPRGQVLETIGWNQRGVLTLSVTAHSGTTFYTRTGDYIARLASYLFLLSLLYYVGYRFRRKDKLVD